MMLCDYNDIRDKINEEPTWWDEHGVPRYCDFAPPAVSDIYASEICLAEVACQNCGRLFKVAISRSRRHGWSSLGKHVLDGNLHYGDPPNIQCCPAGPTMNSELLRVLEFWSQGGTPLADMHRVAEYEGDVGDLSA